MYTVLFSAPYMIPELDRFKPVLESYGIKLIVPEVQERMNEEDLLPYAGTFDGAVCGDDRYTERVIEACMPRLKVISKWGTGIDSIDQVTAKKLGIRIGNTPGAFTNPVADTVMGYILAFARRQPWMDRSMKENIWDKIPGYALHERTLGVIGVGRIGKAVIQRANAFGMTIIGNDIIEIPTDFVDEHKVRMTSLNDLLKIADYVSVNCDLNPTSYHLMNSDTLALMKPNAVLINTARGPVIDEKALIHILQAKEIGGAAMDVFEEEPLPSTSPLLEMENVMLAPHNANSSPHAWERVHRNTIKNLIDGLGISAGNLEEQLGKG